MKGLITDDDDNLQWINDYMIAITRRDNDPLSHAPPLSLRLTF
jgi:hypothetical protein